MHSLGSLIVVSPVLLSCSIFAATLYNLGTLTECVRGVEDIPAHRSRALGVNTRTALEATC